MRLFKKLLLATLSLCAIKAQAGGKFKYYFNHTVDNSVSTGVNAINLNGYIDDTLVAYIDRAKYTLDIAVYNFSSTSSSSSLINIVNAVNSAYTRGVKVRWICNDTSSASSTANTGVRLLNPAIHILPSPSGSGYTIMHNKFMIIDGHSPNPEESIVWTGSTNWSVTQFNTDYDNVVIIQDSALAHAYIGEFNMMWGDTGIAPNASAAKFGHTKTDLGRHNFVIDGKQVELYFSPSDNTNDHIITAINTADKDLYFGIYAFTYGSDATAIVSKKNGGVYVAGIVDTFSATSSYTPYSTFLSGLGRTNYKVYNGTGIYHNKYMIVDPSDACSDPLVLTGSHNWSNGANTDNDENTLIIHDATTANIYYQSFRADFASMGGSLSTITGCPVGVERVSNENESLMIAPNPSNGKFTLNFNANKPQVVRISLVNVAGKTTELTTQELKNGMFQYSFDVPAPGIYFLRVVTENGVFTNRLIKE